MDRRRPFAIGRCPQNAMISGRPLLRSPLRSVQGVRCIARRVPAAVARFASSGRLLSCGRHDDDVYAIRASAISCARRGRTADRPRSASGYAAKSRQTCSSSAERRRWLECAKTGVRLLNAVGVTGSSWRSLRQDDAGDQNRWTMRSPDGEEVAAT